MSFNYSQSYYKNYEHVMWHEKSPSDSEKQAAWYMETHKEIASGGYKLLDGYASINTVKNKIKLNKEILLKVNMCF